MSIAVPLSSYLLGCLCTGYYLVRLRTGKDIRALGSGSVGAKNVSRILGPRGFTLTLLGDAAKGALAVWLARHFTGDAHMEVLAGGGVIAGHIWPAQLGFRGGKGMSTTLGALLVFDFIAILIYLVLAGACWLLLRNTVLSGLVAVALMPLVFLARGAGVFVTLGSAVIVVLILFAHRKNITDEMAAMSARIKKPASTHE
jgi:acyl phosphate:glycerol-3-phosphate acyltransferase